MSTRDWIVLIIVGMVMLLLWWLVGRRKEVQPTGGTNTIEGDVGSSGMTDVDRQEVTAVGTAAQKVTLI